MSKLNIIKLVLISIVIGALSALSIVVLLILLENTISLRCNWLIFILPFSGVLMTYLYKKSMVKTPGRE